MALAAVAGAPASGAVVLGLGMLGLQFAIGAANDWFDVDLDAVSKPGKPIPAGRVSRPAALIVAVLCGGGGLAPAAIGAGRGGSATVAAALAMLGAGLVYDAFLKRTAYGWLAFAVAFPFLPLYAWYGAVGGAPPGAELLLPVAFLAGPTLQLANGMVDVERDAVSGVVGLAGRLGRGRAWVLMAGLEIAINGLAVTTVFSDPVSDWQARALVAGASALAAVGVGLGAARPPNIREWGWRCQAVAIALLALGWLAWRGGGSPPGG